MKYLIALSIFTTGCCHLCRPTPTLSDCTFLKRERVRLTDGSNGTCFTLMCGETFSISCISNPTDFDETEAWKLEKLDRLQVDPD